MGTREFAHSVGFTKLWKHIVTQLVEKNDKYYSIKSIPEPRFGDSCGDDCLDLCRSEKFMSDIDLAGSIIKAMFIVEHERVL